MTMPTPFELGEAIGGNILGGYQKGRELAGIDAILKEASASNDPDAVSNAMNKILTNVSPQNQQAALQVLQNRQSALKQQEQLQQQRNYLQSIGLNPDIVSFPEGIQKEIIKAKTEPKNKEKTAPLLGALDVLKRQKELLKKGNLGPKVAILGTGRNWGSTFGPSRKEGIQDRAEYERLGKNLISFASSIPIRNQREFNTLAESLYDPTMKQEEIAGILDAMERIINNSLAEYETDNPMNVQAQTAPVGSPQATPNQTKFIEGQSYTDPDTGKEYLYQNGQFIPTGG